MVWSDELLRALPSIDRLMQDEAFGALVARYGREPALDAARAATGSARAKLLAAGSQDEASAATLVEMISPDCLAKAAAAWLEARLAPTLRPVINASGVVLHTNLGRAPLGSAVLEAMAAVGSGYSNLEYDLEQGRRGSRYVHAEALLCRLTGAEAAVLVNNNAGAVLLVLAALAAGKRVIVSRGQLVEIGGGFRIPDVMAQSGALLYEVGTTNRTYVRDYVHAIDENTAGVMRVHSSNFYQAGFVHQPTLSELVEAAHDHGVLMIDDLGSGTLLDTAQFGLAHEPMVQESIAAGADVVTFSGDKLLGGPQAGIIVGRAELVARIRQHPLIRALRVDKTTVAGIQANLLHYARGEAEQNIPIWQMLATSLSTLRRRAERLIAGLAEVKALAELIEGRSMVGGGALPEQSLPTWLVSLTVDSADALAARLRAGSPAVVARVHEGRLLVDPRTVLADQDDTLIQQLCLTLRGEADDATPGTR